MERAVNPLHGQSEHSINEWAIGLNRGPFIYLVVVVVVDLAEAHLYRDRGGKKTRVLVGCE